MIYLTRLNGNPFVVNSDLIRYVESSPDTVLTLVNGEKIVVLEACNEVVNRTCAWRARVFAEASGSLQSAEWSRAAESAHPSSLPSCRAANTEE